jgi:hypothetical protein
LIEQFYGDLDEALTTTREQRAGGGLVLALLESAADGNVEVDIG